MYQYYRNLETDEYRILHQLNTEWFEVVKLIPGNIASYKVWHGNMEDIVSQWNTKLFKPKFSLKRILQRAFKRVKTEAVFQATRSGI